MEETVIQEISEQLGMAVDQTGQFISTYLPQYAALRIWTDAFTLFVLLFITATLAFAATRLYKHHEALEADGKWSDFDDFATFVGIASLFGLVIFLIAAIFLVPNIIGWACFPEAQLIREAVNAIGA